MGSNTPSNASKWSLNSHLYVVMLLYFDLVLDLGRNWGRNPLEKLDETPQNSAQNSSKRRLFAVVRGFPSLSGEVAVPLVAAGGRRGLVLDGRLVGFESGWSRREVERDIERDMYSFGTKV